VAKATITSVWDRNKLRIAQVTSEMDLLP